MDLLIKKHTVRTYLFIYKHLGPRKENFSKIELKVSCIKDDLMDIVAYQKYSIDIHN